MCLINIFAKIIYPMKTSTGIIIALLAIIGYFTFKSGILDASYKRKIDGTYKCTTYDKTYLKFNKDGTVLWMLNGIPKNCKYVLTPTRVIVINGNGKDDSFTLFRHGSDTLEAEKKLDGLWLRE